MSNSKLLTVKERALVAATSKKRLSKMDVDELVELHKNVRRARNKYLKLHRRQAGRQVGADRARGVAATKNQRTSEKAEIFEDALANVSAQLAVASKANADQLRSDREKAEAKALRQRAKKGSAKSKRSKTSKK